MYEPEFQDINEESIPLPSLSVPKDVEEVDITTSSQVNPNGRYKNWKFEVLFTNIDLNEIHFDSKEFRSEILHFFSSIFSEIQYEFISEGIVGFGLTSTRIRYLTLARRCTKVFSSMDIALLPSNFLDYFFYEKSSKSYQDCDLLELVDSYISEDRVQASKYDRSDIQVLDTRLGLLDWQIELMKYFYNYKLRKIIMPAQDRKIIWLVDKQGNIGKSTFVKWIFEGHQNDVALLSFGSSGQIRSAVISAGVKKLYIFDMPRSPSKSEMNNFHDVITALEYIKNGLIVSNFYGRYKKLLMNPPHVIVFSNMDALVKLLSADRWLVFKMNKKQNIEPIKI